MQLSTAKNAVIGVMQMAGYFIMVGAATAYGKLRRRY